MKILFLSPIHEWGFSPKVHRALAKNHEVLWRDYRTAPVHFDLMPDADLIFAMRGEVLDPAVLAKWQCPKVNWYAEETVRPEIKDEVRRLADSFDLWAIHDPNRVESMRKMGCRRVIAAPTIAIDPSVDQYRNIARDVDIGFSGGINGRREVIFNELRRRGHQITVAEAWTEAGLSQFYNRCKIVLNIHIIGSENVETRLGEALGAGAPVITEPLGLHGAIPVLERVRGLGALVEVPLSDINAMDEAIHDCQRFDRNMISEFTRESVAGVMRDMTIASVLGNVLAEIKRCRTENPPAPSSRE